MPVLSYLTIRCYQEKSGKSKVSLLGVVALWGDYTFIPADWGS